MIPDSTTAVVLSQHAADMVIVLAVVAIVAALLDEVALRQSPDFPPTGGTMKGPLDAWVAKILDLLRDRGHLSKDEIVDTFGVSDEQYSELKRVLSDESGIARLELSALADFQEEVKERLKKMGDLSSFGGCEWKMEVSIDGETWLGVDVIVDAQRHQLYGILRDQLEAMKKRANRNG